MARPLRIQYPGAFYHITSRGNEQKTIFKNDRDREKFLSYLESATERYGAAIHVYCLMNNHYHLLMETPRGNLSEIMRHINGAYTTYFNFKRERSGHLLQGRYKAILIEADEYAKELSRYIHLNPVRVGAVKSPQEYPWSSYRNYCGEKKAPEWLKIDFILGIFGKGLSSAQKSYREFVEVMICQEGQSPLKEVVFSTILGSKGFVKAVIDNNLSEKKADREVPALRKLKEQVSIEEIEKATEVVFGQEEKTKKKVSIYLSHRFSGRKLKEIGEYFGLSESGVTQASLRLEKTIEEDKKLKRKLALIKNRLKL
ncbi:MAG: transposase [Thermodesulfobacteriota bacterium]|nr:MAG: transposase [Thermodesulfobacteriota bacterium]